MFSRSPVSEEEDEKCTSLCAIVNVWLSNDFCKSTEWERRYSSMVDILWCSHSKIRTWTKSASKPWQKYVSDQCSHTHTHAHFMNSTTIKTAAWKSKFHFRIVNSFTVHGSNKNGWMHWVICSLFCMLNDWTAERCVHAPLYKYPTIYGMRWRVCVSYFLLYLLVHRWNQNVNFYLGSLHNLRYRSQCRM